jgi:hypothetical protein
MPNVNELSERAKRLRVNFTGPIGHETVGELARVWLPDINFHEVEMFHVIDLEEMYTVPAEVFAGLDPDTQQEFAINIDGVAASPPIVHVNLDLRGQGATAQSALLQNDVDANAVLSHGGNVRAGDKFFGSAATKDGSPVPGVGNPRLPRVPLRVRAEFRMLLETLKQDLALAEDGIEERADAIWGDFDVTDLLLRRVVPPLGIDGGPASRTLRQTFARTLIAEHEAGNLPTLELLLQSPPSDGPIPTRVNRTVWLALSTCGLLEYYFTYGYNDFHRYGGLFTNEHEGDNEGCCLVFERLRLADLQNQEDGDPRTVAPLGLITSVHNESNNADESRAVAADPDDARSELEVFVARGSHATYLDPGTHDFFDISDLARESPEAMAVVALVAPWLIPLLMLYEHFNSDPDETSHDGVTGQTDVNPMSDPDTHLPVNLVVTPLSNIDGDKNIYDLPESSAAALALRAFRGTLGAHAGIRDKSPKWENKTRRYFKHLIRALESGKFRSPQRPVVIL